METFANAGGIVPAQQQHSEIKQIDQLDLFRMNNVHATPEDKEETKEIIRILKEDYDQYESEADRWNREKILGKLNEIVTEWIKEVSE